MARQRRAESTVHKPTSLKRPVLGSIASYPTAFGPRTRLVQAAAGPVAPVMWVGLVTLDVGVVVPVVGSPVRFVVARLPGAIAIVLVIRGLGKRYRRERQGAREAERWDRDQTTPRLSHRKHHATNLLLIQDS